jgi:hypothetical protein
MTRGGKNIREPGMSECPAQQRPQASRMAQLKIVARLFPRSQHRGRAGAILTQSRRRAHDACIHHCDRDRARVGSHMGGPGAACGVTRPTRVRRRARRLADIIGFGDSGVCVALSQATGAYGTVPNFGYLRLAGGWRVERHPRMLADITGDQRADIIGFGDAGVCVARARADGSFGAQRSPLSRCHWCRTKRRGPGRWVAPAELTHLLHRCLHRRPS